MPIITQTVFGSKPSDGGQCWCCRRRDDGIGHFIEKPVPKFVWSCRDHIHLIGEALKMKDWDYREGRAAEDALTDIKAYLDKIGKTDLAEFELHEAIALVKAVVDGFGERLAARISNNEAPF